MLKTKILQIITIVFLVSLAIPGVAAAGETISFHTSPEQPPVFQPFFTENHPAKVTIEIRDAQGNLMKNVNVKLTITHVKSLLTGKVFNSGFPYLEGKDVLGGDFYLPDGVLEFDYIFPIRGEYRVSIKAFPANPSKQFTPFSSVFTMHAREQGFEIRNAIILSAMLLFFGIGIGRVYSKAYRRKEITADDFSIN